ncbi:jg14204, partial [Pararge aegeria aegeria]
LYEYVTALSTSLQGLCVAVLYCFCNGEVLAQLRRRWRVLTFRPRANSTTNTTVSREAISCEEFNDSVVETGMLVKKVSKAVATSVVNSLLSTLSMTADWRSGQRTCFLSPRPWFDCHNWKMLFYLFYWIIKLVTTNDVIMRIT